jgi:methionyl aminopeptidase
MTFTIEPMIALGDWHHRLWDDDWTAVTRDGRRTAQFEHSLVVTADGVDILTLAPDGRWAGEQGPSTEIV